MLHKLPKSRTSEKYIFTGINFRENSQIREGFYPRHFLPGPSWCFDILLFRHTAVSTIVSWCSNKYDHITVIINALDICFMLNVCVCCLSPLVEIWIMLLDKWNNKIKCTILLWQYYKYYKYSFMYIYVL